MADIQKTPFVRDLASSGTHRKTAARSKASKLINRIDRKIRDKAVESLTLFLRSRNDLTLVELLKLWKGLFFCFYHSDRPLTQQALARALSYSLVPSLPQATVHRFLRAFWITIGRDFHSLDRLRLDKYLLLIRFYVGVAFEIFVKGNQAQRNEDGKKRKREDAKGGRGKKQKKQKEAEIPAEEEAGDADGKWADLEAYISIIEEGPLCPVNFDPDQPSKPNVDEGNPNFVPMPHGPDGLRYHLVDIWVDELEKVLEFEDEDEGENRKIKGDVPMELLLRPLEKLRTESPYKPVRTRATDALDDDRLIEWGVRERKNEDEEVDSDGEWGGFD
jgi:ribosomal RNA-processing protein 1